MSRVLLVAYYFPPLGGIGSLRARAFAEHLPAFGWEPTVLAPRAGAYHRDETLAVDEARVVRTRSLELSRAGKALLRAGGDDVAPAAVTGPRALARSTARAVLYHPDGQVGWAPGALLAGRRELRSTRYDAVLSSSFPITAHVVARRLARSAGLPWVAELRDPWSAVLPAGSVARRRAARLERRLARDATAMAMTSPSWAAAHGAAWGRAIVVVPNGFEPTAADPATAAAPDPGWTLAYLGTYYPATQDLGAAWDAWRRALDAGTPAPDRLLVVGEPHPRLVADLAARGLGDRLEATGFLPHARAVAALGRARTLLAAGPVDASGVLGGQVAGKVPELLATGLPLVLVGDPAADVAAVVAPHAGTWLVPTGDVDAAAAALAATRAAPARHARDLDGLTRRASAGRMAALLDRAAG